MTLVSQLIVFGRESGGGSIAAVPEAKTYAMGRTGIGRIYHAPQIELILDFHAKQDKKSAVKTALFWVWPVRVSPHNASGKFT